MKIIGIDLDNTIFTFNSFLYDILNKLQSSHKGNKVKYKEVDLNDVKPVSPFMSKLHNVFNPSTYKAYPQAIETINDLHNQGYKIYFISSRPCTKSVINATANWVKMNNVSCDKLILGCSNKAKYASENGVSLFIDDFKRTCKAVEEKGIPTVLFNSKLKSREAEIKMNLKVPQLTVLASWDKVGQFIVKHFKKKEILEQEDKELQAKDKAKNMQENREITLFTEEKRQSIEKDNIFKENE